MSINQHPATARLPRIAAPETHTNSGQSSARQNHLRQLILDVRKISAAIGGLGLLVLCCGITLAALCTVWAIEVGVPYPMALAAGYCTAACSACLCAALLLVLNSDQTTARTTEKSQPNYAAWTVVKAFRISDASRLWCNIEPGCAATQESLAWSQAMLAAIKSGELPIRRRAGEGEETIDRERANPSWATEIERTALKSWASSHGHVPRFLHG